MKLSDMDEFGQMLVTVADLYGKTLSEFAISLYFNALREFDLAAVRQAFDRYVRNPDNGQFMPKPADLIRMLQGSSVDSSMVAWSKVDKAVRQVGTYASVAFDDPLIHRVIDDMGGWIKMGQQTENDWPFVAKEFETRYKGFANRNERPEYPPVMSGVIALENGARGVPESEVRLIGDAMKAMQVMKGGERIGLQVTAAQAIRQLGLA